MPRLSPAATLQIIREELKAEGPPPGPFIVDSEFNVLWELVDDPGPSSPSKEEAPATKTTPTRQRPLCFIEKYGSESNASGDSSSRSWVDVDLAETARSTAAAPGSPPQVGTPQTPPLSDRHSRQMLQGLHANPPIEKPCFSQGSLCTGPSELTTGSPEHQKPGGVCWIPSGDNDPEISLNMEAENVDEGLVQLAGRDTVPISEASLDGSPASQRSHRAEVQGEPTASSFPLTAVLFSEEAAGGFPTWSQALEEAIAEERALAMWVSTPRVLRFFLRAEAMHCHDFTTTPITSASCDRSSSPSTAASSSPVSGLAGLLPASASLDSPPCSSREIGAVSEAKLDMIESIFDVLGEVADRPFPLELLLLSTAFARLAGTGAGQSSRNAGAVNSRHLEVEALILKYTTISSRLVLRTELETWFQKQDSSDWCIDGPDDAGFSLSFEALSAFIWTHAAHKTHLKEAFDMLPLADDAECIAHGLKPGIWVKRTAVQSGLEVALAPLLAGLPTALAGHGRCATTAARRIVRRAAMIALRGRERFVSREETRESHCIRAVELWTTLVREGTDREACRWSAIDGGKQLVCFENFTELFRSAASMVRLCVMHLTGDVVRWRNCIAAPSPRVQLRGALGGG